MLFSCSSKNHLSENKTINVFPIDYFVQLLKLTSQWKQYLTLQNKPFSILTSDVLYF